MRASRRAAAASWGSEQQLGEEEALRRSARQRRARHWRPAMRQLGSPGELRKARVRTCSYPAMAAEGVNGNGGKKQRRARAIPREERTMARGRPGSDVFPRVLWSRESPRSRGGYYKRAARPLSPDTIVVLLSSTSKFPPPSFFVSAVHRFGSVALTLSTRLVKSCTLSCAIARSHIRTRHCCTGNQKCQIPEFWLIVGILRVQLAALQRSLAPGV